MMVYVLQPTTYPHQTLYGHKKYLWIRSK